MTTTFMLALVAVLCSIVLGTEDDLYVNITILESATAQGAEFYNWNRVRVKYCDGSSFISDVEQVDSAILSGISAGGLATILNWDKFKFLVPENARVKCIADAGFFINGKTIYGSSYIQEMYRRIVNLHGSAKNLPLACTSSMEPSLCFFPQNVVPYVQPALFIINSIYDYWQIRPEVAGTRSAATVRWWGCFQFDRDGGYVVLTGGG
ncbi:putative protein notum -like protein [Capsicum annuum]|nr:putative protein notum -like protein [Capsicum annuum]KAF3664538.1 putative protein notum -like protein [Capsicum annuum]